MTGQTLQNSASFLFVERRNFMETKDIPLGLKMALAENPEAMNYFVSLSEEQKQSIIEQTHKIHSKSEMQSFAGNFGKNNSSSKTGFLNNRFS